MRQWQLDERPACSVKDEPIPLEIKCMGCQAEIEVWSDETEAYCNVCGRKVIILNKKGG